jgi:hypothetical protein
MNARPSTDHEAAELYSELAAYWSMSYSLNGKWFIMTGGGEEQKK